MWSRVRHRRLQALALLALAALLTTCLCLGPLYQRAMEQGLAGSVLATATAEQTSLLLDSKDRSEQQLEDLFPHQLDPYFAAPVVSRNALVSVQPPVGVTPVATRLYAVDGACHHLEVVSGRCPTRPGEVMVSSADVRTNGWTLGSRVQFSERLDASQTAEPGSGTLSLVGVYKPPSPETDWLSAPLTGRAGTVIADVGPATDDWVTSPETMTSSGAPTTWHQITSTVVWSLNPATVDHDTLVRIGPVVDRILQQTLQGSSIEVLASTDLPALSKRVASGGEQGRTTVVVLISQLLVLVAVVLWMVLVAATEDRRRELALARLRGRGRRGAVGYLLSELLPLTLAGVAAGVLASPFVMALVARVIFPVPVPLELSGSFLLAALAAVAAVVAVVLAAAGRAVREPVDSLLRAVPSRHLGVGASAAEISLIVFSLSAVTVLLTGRLEGPLATLAPTLLAVAAGLLLGRSLAPATRYLSRRLLRRGRAVAAAGIITAVRRPAARRVLAMVVVATALLVFCVDAMVTGQHNRANAAEQLNGAAYSLDVDPSSRLTDVVAALEAADPEHQHLTPVVTTTNNGLSTAPTLAVDPTAFPRVAYFPLSRPDPADWDAIRAPSVAPVELTGDSLAGTVASTGVRLAGPSKKLVDDLMISVEVLDTQGLYETVQLSVIPTGDASVQFAAAMPCAEGCTVTGVAVRGPVGGRISGTVVLRGLSVDGQPFSLGPTTSWRRATDSGATVIPAADPAGGLGLVVSSDIASPPVMLSAWVPGPVPALVSGDETGVFSAQGTGGQVDLKAVATVARVPGAPPGARVVDLQGMLRRPERPDGNVAIEVWADDAQALARARTELEKRGATPRRTTTVDDVRAQLDASPAVWSLELSVLVGAAAVLVAMLVMVVATATTWRARATDLAALRMAGLADRSLRRLELLGQVPVVVAGAVAGTACGLVAAVLTLPGLRQFTDPPAVDTTDFSTRWPAVLVGALLAAVVLTVVAVAASRWTARRASLGRVREVV